MTEITMPKLSDSMEEGTIVAWVKHDGEPVAIGDDLVEIETDKATTTYVAEAEGVLTIVAPDGATLPVGAPIARVGAGAGEPAAPAPAAPAAATPAAPPTVAPAAAEPGAAGSAPAASEAASAPPAASAPVANGNGKRNGNGSGRPLRVTPLARRVALAHGIALESVDGTGPLGRVTRRDVLTAAGAHEPQPLPSAAPLVAALAADGTLDVAASAPPVALPASAGSPAPAAAVAGAPPAFAAPASAGAGGAAAPPAAGPKGTVEVVELTRLQTVVARRMAEAKATVPEFQVQTAVAMDAALAFRAQVKETGERPPSVNDLIVKAAALALRAHPRANASYRDGRFELYSRVNVGIAVAGDDALVVPTIFDADRASLGTIAAEARGLAERVRDGSITPAELSGATFTVSNLGMFGMTAITPVINAPQAAILGVGATRTVLARNADGEIVDRHEMTLTLSCDHRILYGADAARFLSAIRDLLEHPLRLAL